MTEHLIDLASYQEGIDLAKVKAAGFTKVNVKLSQGNWYQWSRAGEYIAKARDLGLGICTFHWLDNSASGGEQARIVLGLMRRYGVIDGTVHQCDCEDSARPASWTIWRDYMTAMQDGLQRHVVNYTGDWWWPQHMGNRGAEVTPYLWAAPNDGYDGAYLGDTSGHWRAGYGGWGDYSMLQYAVQPVAGAGGGDLSKTAIRDPQVWAALTGAGDGDDMAGSVADWVVANVPVPGGAPGQVMGMHAAVSGLVASAQEEKVRDATEATAVAGLRAAIDAMAAVISKGGGSVDVAAITAAVDARTAEVKQLVEQRHADEMAELRRSQVAEVAGLQAELAARRPITTS